MDHRFILRQSWAVASAELGRTLDFLKVATAEKNEVLAAFAAHKGEVTAGYVEAK